MNNLLAVNLPAIVDAVAIFFVATFTIIGYAKGFVKQFVSAFGTILSLLLAVLLCTSVATFLQSQFGFVETVSKSIGGTLSNILGADVSHLTLGELVNEQGREILVQKGVAPWLIDIVMLFVNDTSALPMDTTIYQILCPTFAYYVVIIIAVVSLFIVFKLMFFILGKYVHKLHSIKMIAVLDNTLGCLLGLFCGIVYLELIIMLLSIIPIQAVQDVYSAVHASVVANFIEKINLYSIVLKALSTANVVGFVKSLLTKTIG